MTDDTATECADCHGTGRVLAARGQAGDMFAPCPSCGVAHEIARWNYEQYDSHFSMPGGLSWEAYKADDPDGAEAVYLAPARALAERLVAEAVADDRRVRAELHADCFSRREVEQAERGGAERVARAVGRCLDEWDDWPLSARGQAADMLRDLREVLAALDAPEDGSA